MRKEYISPEIKLLMIDELCYVNASVVRDVSDVVVDGFDVVEDTAPEGGNDDWWNNADNWGGS